ncbi:MAG: peptidase [Ilumatobacteraceae bacterium]|nr:peptidase [Ilumatobacteraceae bacterium]
MIHVAAHVLIVGRLSSEAKGVRGDAFAAGQGYFRGVQRAGGVPLMLPPIPALLDRLPDLLARMDALVLHGGGDVDPRRYGEAPIADELYGIVEEHDEVELAVVRAALAMDMPILGICRGMQIVNVALGGSLVQHIGTEDHWFALHPVELTAGSRLWKAMGTDRPAACHSVHHQSIGRIGSGLTLVGQAADGMSEAMEVDDARWAVCVQWHPEDTAATDPQQQGLFDELVRQAQPN